MHATTWILLLAIGGALGDLSCKSDDSANFAGCILNCPAETFPSPRTYSCTDAAPSDQALFLWVNGTYVSTTETFSLALTFNNASGIQTIVNGEIETPFAFNASVIGQQVSAVFTHTRVPNKDISFELNSIFCTPTSFANTGLTLNWVDPEGAKPGQLTYVVLDGAAPAQGTPVTSTSFALKPQCDLTPHTFTVQSSLPFPPLSCLTPASGVTLTLNQTISPIANLAVLSVVSSTSASAATLSFNASWTVPTVDSGCALKYTGRLSNAFGVSVTKDTLAVEVVGGVAYLTSAWVEANPNFGDGKFTLEIFATSPVGNSPVASTTFAVDPCLATCPVSAETCAFSCVCETPANVSVILTRTYTCQKPGVIPGFFGGELLNVTNGVADVTYGYWNESGAFFSRNDFNSSHIFPVVSGYLNGSNISFTLTTAKVDAPSYFFARARTFGCKVTLTPVGELGFQWLAPVDSTDLVYTVYQDGKVVAGPAAISNFTATPDCNVVGGKANFTVSSTLQWGENLPCIVASVPLELNVNPPPAAPTGVAVANIQSNMNDTAAVLSFDLSWTEPAQQLCAHNYTANITVPGTSFTINVPLNTAVDNTTKTIYVPGGIALNDFAFSSKSVEVIVSIHSAAGSRSSTTSSFTSPELCANSCPKTLNTSATGCHIRCTCRGPSYADFTLARTYTCDGFNEAGFFWSTLTLAHGEAQLALNYTTPLGPSSIVDGKVIETTTYAPQALRLINTTAAITATTLPTANETHVVDFESHAVGCSLTAAQGGKLLLTWTSPAFSDAYLTYTVFRNGQAVGPIAAHEYTVPGECQGQANYSVQSSLTGFNLTCPTSSNSVNMQLSFKPDPVTGLTVQDSKSTATTITVLPAWTIPASFGECELIHYIVHVTSDHGFSSITNLNASQVVNNNGTITVPNGVELAGGPVSVNAVYTITVSVLTLMGESTKKKADFYLPGFLCRDTCAMETKAGSSCNINCVCEFPKDSNLTAFVNRSFTCDFGKQAGFFFTTEVTNFANPSGFFDASYVNNAAQTTVVEKGGVAVAFNVTNNLASTHTLFSLRPSDPVNNTETFTFKALTIPCVVPVESKADQLQIMWTPSEAVAPYFTYSVWSDGVIADGAIDGNTFTATPKCNAVANFSVLTTLKDKNLNCFQASEPIQLRLGHAPSQVTPPSIVSPAIAVNSTLPLSVLTFNASWVPADQVWGCTQVDYYMIVNVSGTTNLFSGLVTGASVSNTSVAVSTTLVLDNVTLDTNAEYTVAIITRTAVGDSAPAVTTFSFGSPSSSSSGLSNTVIAGIAVGATIGVVAIALIVYKCMSSRRDYEPIGGSSGSSNV